MYYEANISDKILNIKEHKMAELKTRVNDASVDKFLKGIKDETKREDSFQVLEIMKR